MKVSSIMNTKPVHCTVASSVATAASLMLVNDLGILLVTEGDRSSKRLVGVVTDRDLCNAVLAPGRDPIDVPIHECMTREPACCHPGDGMDTVIRLMAKRQVRRIPIVDEKFNIKGVVSIGDLVRAHAISPTALFDLMNKICQPISQAGKQIGSVKRAA